MITDNKAGSIEEAALAFASRGFRIVPNRPKTKKPIVSDWPSQASTDPEVIRGWFRANPRGLNIGIALGPTSKIIDIEADSEEAEKTYFELFGEDAPVVPTWKSSRGKHRLFRWTGDLPEPDKNLFKIGDLEFRTGNGSEGAQSIVPPSRHQSGVSYEWLVGLDEAEPVPIPPAVLARIRARLGCIGKPEAGGLVLQVAVPVEDLATAAGASQGGRHTTALRLIGAAIGRGGDPAEVARQAVEWSRRCWPPMEEGEVLKIVSDLASKQPATSSTRGQAAAASSRHLPPAPPWSQFPIECIPQPVRSYVEASSESIGADPAQVAVAVLPALAAAIGNSRVIRLKRTWIEPAVLWGAVVGDSGSQKSPALDAGSRFIRKRQAAAVEDYRREHESFEAEKRSFELSYDQWKRSGRKKSEPAPPEPIEPVCERFACSDVTVEGLGLLLSTAPRGLLLVRDELGGWLGSFDQYRAGAGGDVAHWLSMYGARDLLVDRKSGDKKTIFVRRAAVSIVGTIQPATLGRLLGRQHFENGLAARFLLAMPPKRSRKWSEHETDESLDRRVEGVFERLYRLDPVEGDHGPEPVEVELSVSGRGAWVEFFNRHADRQVDASGDLAAVLAKIEGAAARLALVVHEVRRAAGDRGVSELVDEKSILAGVRLAEWFAAEADRVYRVLGESDEDQRRREILDLIRRRGGGVTPNELRKRSRQFETNEEAELFLAGLVKSGLGSWREVEPGPKGGRPAIEFRLSESLSETRTPIFQAESEVSVTESAPESDSSGLQEWKF